MEPEIKISVFDLVKTPTPEGRYSEEGYPAGDLIRKSINDNWEKYRKIIISFNKIVKMSRVFVDEAFAKLLEDHALDEINQKVFFPDAPEPTVKQLNAAFKLRMKILNSQKAREE
ncbi:MAG: STAS-like domain-containing protein [Nitrospinales bacterium]